MFIEVSVTILWRSIGSLMVKGFLLVIPSLCSGQASKYDVSNTMDSIIRHYMTTDDYILGGVAAMVYSDSSVFLEGYGYANIDSKDPFHPCSTTVEIASVTKLITTTALLQLWEQGSVELNAPVSKYLPYVDLNNNHGIEVRVIDLLTHSSGLDDRMSFMEFDHPDQIPSLRDYCIDYLPKVVWEPGQFYNYSNYGMNLVALLVEEISGQDYQDYVEKNITSPLDMSMSGVGQEERLMRPLMRRYRLKATDEDSIYSKDLGILCSALPGATGFKTTASDMANFIRSYLNHGNLDGQRILLQSTVDKAFEPHLIKDTDLFFQQGLGWRILKKNGNRIIYHDGDDRGSQSSLVLFPEMQLGYFLCFNNQVGHDVKFAIRRAIWKLVYPNDDPPLQCSNDRLRNLDHLTGSYYYMNDGQSTFEKLSSLIGDIQIEVKSQNDTTLLIEGSSYCEIKPDLFQALDENIRTKFFQHSGISYLTFGFSTYRRPHPMNDPVVHRNLMFIALAVILLLTAWMVLRMLRSITRSNFSEIQDRGTILLFINNSLLLAFLGLLYYTSQTQELGKGIPFILTAAFTCSLLALCLFPVTLVLVSNKIFRRRPTLVLKSSLECLNMGAIAMSLSILWQYNLIGYHYV